MSAKATRECDARRLPPDRHTVFKVVRKSPASRKIIKPIHSNLTKSDVGIAVHNVRSCFVDGEAVRLLVSVSGVASGSFGDGDIDTETTRLLNRRHLEALPDLRNDFLEWRCNGGLGFQPRPALSRRGE